MFSRKKLDIKKETIAFSYSSLGTYIRELVSWPYSARKKYVRISNNFKVKYLLAIAHQLLFRPHFILSFADTQQNFHIKLKFLIYFHAKRNKLYILCLT